MRRRRPKRAASRQRPGGRTRSSGRRRRPRTDAGQKRASFLRRRASWGRCLTRTRGGRGGDAGGGSRVSVKQERGRARSLCSLLPSLPLVLTTLFFLLPSKLAPPPFFSSQHFSKTHFAMAFSLRAARLPTVRRSWSSRGRRKCAARCRGGGVRRRMIVQRGTGISFSLSPSLSLVIKEARATK